MEALVTPGQGSVPELKPITQAILIRQITDKPERDATDLSNLYVWLARSLQVSGVHCARIGHWLGWSVLTSMRLLARQDDRRPATHIVVCEDTEPSGRAVAATLSISCVLCPRPPRHCTVRLIVQCAFTQTHPRVEQAARYELE